MMFLKTILAFAAMVGPVADGLAAELPISDEMKRYVKRYYNQSADTPLYLLFESYLQTLHSRFGAGEVEALDYVTDTLELGHTPEGEKRALEITSVLLQSYERLNEENLRERSKILCTIDPNSRSDREIVGALNTVDYAGEIIAKKHLRISSSMLRTDERKTFLQLLARNRAGYFYISLDYRFLLDDAMVSPQIQLESACQALEIAKYYVE